MSRSARLPSSGRRSTTAQAYRRMNHSVDHSQRNKRRTFALICTITVLAAAAAIAVAVAPLFNR